MKSSKLNYVTWSTITRCKVTIQWIIIGMWSGKTQKRCDKKQTFTIYRVQVDALVTVAHHPNATGSLRHDVARRLAPTIFDRCLGTEHEQMLARLIAPHFEQIAIAFAIRTFQPVEYGFTLNDKCGVTGCLCPVLNFIHLWENELTVIDLRWPLGRIIATKKCRKVKWF